MKMTKKINEVTFFKGIAILMVIFVHYAQVFKLPKLLSEITRFFQMGCQIFFVLSAFTLCISYASTKPKYFDFIKKRIKKICIGYWIMIFVYAILRVGISFLLNGNILTAINPLGIVVNILFLNGIVPNNVINNQIVFGGWFVGTIMILYLLFPILYRIFNINNKQWKKSKIILFPVSIMFVSSLILIIVCKKFNIEFLNNKFLYFNFINQITCFSIGFSLYELYIDKTINKVKIPFIKFLLFLIISIITFYGNFKYSFIFVPFIFSISFTYLYITYTRCNRKSINKITKKIEKFGNYNWTIYLCHSIIVYYLIKIIIKITEQFVPSIILFFILLPISYILIYYCGKLFQSIITSIENKVFKKKFKAETKTIMEEN